MLLSLVLLSSCATAPRPAPITMNKSAGRGGWLIVNLRLKKNGKELPFMVDTGSPGTLFDKSLASRLTHLPLGTWTVPTGFGKQKSGIYYRLRGLATHELLCKLLLELLDV